MPGLQRPASAVGARKGDNRRPATSERFPLPTMMSHEGHDPILSPCIGLCRLDGDGYCEGCLRSADEIARWVVMGEAERRRIVLHVLPRRTSGPA